MGCSVCCGYAGGLAPNPAGCPCCGPDYDEHEERYGYEDEPEPCECDRCGDMMYDDGSDAPLCFLCRIDIEAPAEPEPTREEAA
jgi:hypothetical protein